MKTIYTPSSEQEFRTASEPKLKDFFNDVIAKAANMKFSSFSNLVSNIFFLIIMLVCLIAGVAIIGMFYKDSISEDGKLLLNGILIVGLVITFIGIIGLMLFVFIRKRRKRRLHNFMRNNLNQEELFKLVFTGLNGIELSGLDTSVVSNKLSSHSIFSMPGDATLERHSSLMRFKIFDKYSGYVQTGNFEWVSRTAAVAAYSSAYSSNRSRFNNDNNGGAALGLYFLVVLYRKLRGKKANIEEKATGITEIQDNSSPQFNFSLNKSISLSKMEKVNLESTTFVKQFSPRSNDQVKVRMAFTPLSMEEIQKAHNQLKKPKWNLEKNQNGFLLNFEPLDKDQLIINSKLITQILKNQSSIPRVVNSLIEDVFTDVYQWYLILCMALIPIV